MKKKKVVVNQPTESELNGNKVIEKQRSPQDDISDDTISIKRKRVSNILIYEITEEHFESLIKGNEESNCLNFAVGLISAAISFLIALLTNDYSGKPIIQYFFRAVMIGGFVGGCILLVFWHKGKKKRDKLVNDLRKK